MPLFLLAKAFSPQNLCSLFNKVSIDGLKKQLDFDSGWSVTGKKN